MKHNHDEHVHVAAKKNTNEYLKFTAIMIAITVSSLLISSYSSLPFLESFMGVFFIVFAGFKIAQLKEFAYGFQSYDLIAKRSLVYSFTYPFLQLMFGVLYLLSFSSLALNLVVLVVSLISGAGVLNSLIKKQQVHCVCLGNVIKLPLSTISFVEDFGMAAMALIMIIIG